MKRLVFVLLALMSLATIMRAETFIVDSEESFHDAQEQAVSGDSILWRSGTFIHVELDIDKDGLYISAMELGGTIFTGTSAIDISGDSIVFRGFQFVDGDVGNSDIINITGSHILFTEVNIRGFESFKYLRVRESSQYVTISYCNFENRVNLDDQNILSILVSNDHPGFHKIQYCSFKNFDGGGNDDGIEPIRIGLSSQADRESRTLVEYCYFTRCDGDGEIISSKAGQNVYRYNTFDNNPLAELVLRHGSEAVVYGNFFLNGKGGIRVREGQQHYIYNNYFYNLQDRAIFLQNDDSDPLDDINIAFNTIINCGEVRLGRGADAPTNVMFANNIFADPKDNLFQDPTETEQWISNLSIGGLGLTRPAGIIDADPLLVENEVGFFVIDETSPAIDAAQGGYKPLPQFEGMDAIDTALELDIMQQLRPSDIGSKDIGCSEYPHTVVLQPYVTEENTGPHYNTNDPTATTEALLLNEADYDMNVYPTPTDGATQVDFVSREQLDVVVVLLDLDGQVVKQWTGKQAADDHYSLSVDFANVPTGLYVVQLSGYQEGRLKVVASRQVMRL